MGSLRQDRSKDHGTSQGHASVRACLTQDRRAKALVDCSSTLEAELVLYSVVALPPTAVPVTLSELAGMPGIVMCRNIKTLFNFAPPATDVEIRAASLQFVRKLSGFNKPSLANAAAFTQAVEDVAAVARTLIDSLSTTSRPRDRQIEAEKARALARRRFAK